MNDQLRKYSAFCKKVRELEDAIFNPATNMPENLQEDLNDLCEDNRGFEKLYDTYTTRGLAVPQIEMTFWGIYGS